MQEFIAFTITGLAIAGIYAITASGLTLTYMTTGVFNFAHGAIGMVIAFCFWELRFNLGVAPIVAWAICLLVLAPIVGLLLERVVMRQLEGTPEVTRLVVTMALMLALVSLAILIWNPDTFRSVSPLLQGKVLTIFSVRVAYNDVIVLAVAIAVAIGLWVLLSKTSVGVAMRATVDNPDLVRLSGAQPRHSAQIAWIISVMLAGLAGILVAPRLTLGALPLTLIIINAYAAAIIGRLRNLPMTFAGALVLGLLTSYAIGYVDPLDVDALRGLVGAIPVILLFGALLFMPSSKLSGHQGRSTKAPSLLTWKYGVGVGVGCVVSAAMLAAILSRGDLFGSTQMWGFAIVALSLVPLAGYGGRLSLCQMTFAGVGAIVVAHVGSSIPGILLAGAVTAILGALVALPARRLTGIYMALATAAIAVLFDRWIFKFPEVNLFGGSFDLFQAGTLTIDRPSPFGLDLGTSTAYFIFGAVVFALMVMVVVSVRRSKFGMRVLAITDSERAAVTLGINVRRHTLAVFSLSAAMAGIGGAVIGMGLTSVTPESFTFFVGLPLLLFMVVLGVDSPLAAVFCGMFLASSIMVELPAEVTPLAVGALAIMIGRQPTGPHPLSALKTSPPAMATLAGLGLAIWVLALANTISTDVWFVLTFAALPAVGAVLVRRLGGKDTTVVVHEDVARGLSNPLESLGLSAPLRKRDREIIDRVLGLPRHSKADA